MASELAATPSTPHLSDVWRCSSTLTGRTRRDLDSALLLHHPQSVSLGRLSPGQCLLASQDGNGICWSALGVFSGATGAQAITRALDAFQELFTGLITHTMDTFKESIDRSDHDAEVDFGESIK